MRTSDCEDLCGGWGRAPICWIPPHALRTRDSTLRTSRHSDSLAGRADAAAAEETKKNAGRVHVGARCGVDARIAPPFMEATDAIRIVCVFVVSYQEYSNTYRVHLPARTSNDGRACTIHPHLCTVPNSTAFVFLCTRPEDAKGCVRWLTAVSTYDWRLYT